MPSSPVVLAAFETMIKLIRFRLCFISSILWSWYISKELFLIKKVSKYVFGKVTTPKKGRNLP